MEEMRRGYKPGTYSNFKTKHRHKKKNNYSDDTFDTVFNTNIKQERSKERADLKEGIDDLMTRINNLEVIMESEKGKGE